MALLFKLILAVSLLANGIILWAYEGAQGEINRARMEVERLQGQLGELSTDLRSARAEVAQLRSQVTASGSPAVSGAPLGQPAPPEVMVALQRIQASGPRGRRPRGAH
ncbi:MAG: hypothetical protein ACKVVP_03280 [Chloroflexota bacterium]